MISSCKLKEIYLSDKSSKGPISNKKDSASGLPPFEVYDSPPLTELNQSGSSGLTTASSSPYACLIPTSEILEINGDEDTTHEQDLVKLATPISISSISDEEAESQEPENNSIRVKKKSRRTSHIAKRHSNRMKSTLMSHEKILFSCSPRPATKHSSEKVVYPQNLLNKDLCLKKNTQCSQCGSKKTPEWRSGPTGSRTLCNACGLFFAKLTKKLGHEDASRYFLNLKKVGNVFDRRIGALQC